MAQINSRMARVESPRPLTIQARALELCQRFAHTDWPPVLDRPATLVNPLLPAITAAGFPGYWWVIDQSEYAIYLRMITRIEQA